VQPNGKIVQNCAKNADKPRSGNRAQRHNDADADADTHDDSDADAAAYGGDKL